MLQGGRAHLHTTPTYQKQTIIYCVLHIHSVFSAYQAACIYFFLIEQCATSIFCYLNKYY